MIFLKKWTTDKYDLSNNLYPANLVCNYDQTLTPNILATNTIVDEPIYNLRRAAECHRQVRRHIQSIIKPNMKIFDICNQIENKTRELLGDDLKAGIGFPTGFSINNCAAHDSATVNDTRTIKYDDVCKIDFGTHCNGYIIDSAFSVGFNPKFEPLLEAAKEGMWSGIRMAGPDVIINEVSKEIQETIESFEIELNGKTIPIKSSRVLGGHNIKQYTIHAGKLILGVPHEQGENTRLEAGDQIAIETFPTTGDGNMYIDKSAPITLYMLNKEAKFQKLNLAITNKVFTYIKNKRSTLPFCSRWIYDVFGKQGEIGLTELYKKNLIIACPPIIDTKNTFSAQFEHTIYLHEWGKEVLSFGDDY